MWARGHPSDLDTIPNSNSDQFETQSRLFSSTYQVRLAIPSHSIFTPIDPGRHTNVGTVSDLPVDLCVFVFRVFHQRCITRSETALLLWQTSKGCSGSCASVYVCLVLS
jgi:hypothetical protein